MKKKELKDLARKIAEQEKILQDLTITSEQREEAENKIFFLSSKDIECNRHRVKLGFNG